MGPLLESTLLGMKFMYIVVGTLGARLVGRFTHTRVSNADEVAFVSTHA